MKQALSLITLLVDDYDKAINFYTTRLQFELLEDTKLDEEKRWVRIAPRGSEGTSLLLARAVTPLQSASIGNQSGGRVFLFLTTDNFTRDYNAMLENGIEFIRQPVHEKYGTVAVFKDLYGNLWDLIG